MNSLYVDQFSIYTVTLRSASQRGNKDLTYILKNMVHNTSTITVQCFHCFVQGYKYRQAYIATQGCLAETTEDFWRMLWEHNSTIIVMLTKLREMGRVGFLSVTRQVFLTSLI